MTDKCCTDKYDGAKFIHFREDIDLMNEHNGGATMSYKVMDGRTYVGVAYCHPKDRYVKAYGRAKAFGYMKQLIARFYFDGSQTAYGVLRQLSVPSEATHEELISLMNEEGYVPR